MRTDGQTDVTKLTVALRNFANAPVNRPVSRTASTGSQAAVCICLYVRMCSMWHYLYNRILRNFPRYLKASITSADGVGTEAKRNECCWNVFFYTPNITNSHEETCQVRLQTANSSRDTPRSVACSSYQRCLFKNFKNRTTKIVETYRSSQIWLLASACELNLLSSPHQCSLHFYHPLVDIDKSFLVYCQTLKQSNCITS